MGVLEAEYSVELRYMQLEVSLSHRHRALVRPDRVLRPRERNLDAPAHLAGPKHRFNLGGKLGQDF